ncbi:four-carbon acid sugar kinase family protein [Treponema parvum]|uniref:Four-carbon acid sugar kinase family protein n=1 Tax=Treponema parvum TaxID=138851 RepID=A0A975IFU7_9SPIR|nr:four-carbon acid sugar kinase family protein [Treponema parvum]QTQ14669.1 four-carbon acid sugar kinase family protein [Treponema parvum]
MNKNESNKNMELTEITDDLTGAADSCSYFTARGKAVKICISGITEFDRSENEILSINLSSRNITKEEARLRHFELFRRLRVQDKSFVLKKIGTGFRGNDSMELCGLLEAADEYVVFVIDNAPDLGTFTLYGHQYCEGEILTKSLYAHDPIMPPTESYIPSILGQESRMPIGLVDIDAVKRGKIAQETEKNISNGCRIIVFDAITKEDTIEIIKTLHPVYKKVFWTGSLGIADGIAQYFFGSWQKHHFEIRNIKCLGFCASAYEIAKKQIALSSERGLQIAEIDIDECIDGDENSVIDAVILKAKKQLSYGNVMVVPNVKKYSYQLKASKKIMEVISAVSKELCRENFDRLVVVGGETSQNIFSAMNTNHLKLGLPLQAGVAQGTIIDGMLAGREFSLKGGSMGQADTIEKMLCRCEVYY